MKKHLSVIFSILLLSTASYSQLLNKADVKPGESQIIVIDKIQQDIKINMSKYNKTEKQKDSNHFKTIYTSNAKELKLAMYYSKNEKTPKGVIDIRTDYYFNNGLLIYAEKSLTDVSSHNVVDFEKYYLEKEQLFAWMVNGKRVNNSLPIFKQAEKEFAGYVVQLKKVAFE